MPERFAAEVSPALRAVVQQVRPGAEILEVVPFGADPGADPGAEVDGAATTLGDAPATTKGAGYGVPLRIRLRAGGREEVLVFHVAKPDRFGHDRRADRAAELILAYDTMGLVPGHVPVLDVGAVDQGSRGLVSLAGTGEFYLLTGFAPGRPYAEDLRRIAGAGRLEPGDLERCEALARYLVGLHEERLDAPQRYVRAVRDLLGSGEGIFGMVDGYPPDAPGAPPERLQRIEAACLRWRWRLRGREARLRRIHGDFHPFNVLFDGGAGAAGPVLLDAARGCAGDPVDDVTALVVNYPFFAADAPEAWRGALQVLWRRFWEVYLDESGDEGLLEVAAPWLAWRGLVVASPAWYPALPAEARDRMLTLVERALAAERFDPDLVEDLFP